MRLTRLLLFVVLIPAVLRAQGSGEIVRGVVRDALGRAIPDANITVTGEASQSIRVARTSKDGRFTTFFPDAQGAFTVVVRQIGYTPALRRVIRTETTSTISLDFTLFTSALPLPPLAVSVPGTGRTGVERLSVGGLGENLTINEQFVIDPADLNAILQLTPGVSPLGDSGYSALGAPANQNTVLLDGMLFDGASIPPDALCSINLTTTTSDVARGGFTGGQTSMSTCRGREFSESTVRASRIDPALTWSDAAFPSSSAYHNVVSGFVAGPIRNGVAHYRLSFSASDRGETDASLDAPRPAILTQIGLDPDTLAAVRSALDANRIAVHPPQGSVAFGQQSATSLLSLDWSPGAATSLTLNATGAWTHSLNAGLGELAYSSTGTERTQGSGRLMVTAMTFGHGVTDELASTFGFVRSILAPTTALPHGIVRVGAQYPGGRDGLTTLSFGGAGVALDSRAATWSLRNQLSSAAQHGAHHLTAGQQLTVDWNTLSEPASSGTYTFQSIADLAANQPTSYVRRLDATGVDYGLLTGAAWVSDLWNPSRAISFQGGLRLDVSHIDASPPYNAAIDSAFGLRTDRLPSTIGLSPRLGFAWLVKRRPPEQVRIPGTNQITTVRYADANLLGEPRANVTAAGITLFGSVGAYRGTPPLALASDVVGRTGTPGSARTLGCAGSATPVPDWTSAAGSVFATCADGQEIPGLAAFLRPVSLLAPGYRPPTDWKVNTELSGLYWRRWRGSVALVLKHGVNYQSVTDLNLEPAPAFQLMSESDRPVYAPLNTIISQTGEFEPAAGRRVGEFSSVRETLSDLTNDAAQLNVAITSPRLWGESSLHLDYFYTAQRFKQRGFDGTTAGDPFAVETLAGAQPRHVLVISTTANRLWWLTYALRLNIMSGASYTPVVAEDINGDGLSNDRAFVPDPAVTPDTVLAGQIRQLLRTAPSGATACLQAQLRAIALANSCHGPWQARLDVRLGFAPPARTGVGRRLQMTLGFINAGAAVMRLAGLSSRLVEGNGPPDPRLLYVTAFDPASRDFRYRVNQQFGQPANVGAAGNRFPPFQVQLGIQYALHTAPENPLLTSMGLKQQNGRPFSDEDIDRALRPYTVNPVDIILQLRDSLQLTPAQVTQLEVLSSGYRSLTDSATRILGDSLRRRTALIDRDMADPLRQLVGTLLPRRSEVRDQALAVLTDVQQAIFRSIFAKP